LHVAHHKGVVGKAANFVLDVAARMKNAGISSAVASREQALVPA